ncbi:MAG TPA: hypothetical protein VH083_22690 [Myxococcales bacterium]|jgi:hypothetical protein|nr:hypothetical protein [Myxococcales bacterium]
MPIKTFKAEVIQGHKGVLAVLVPFDPEELWKQKPVKLAGRRHGWLVKGSIDGEPFDGYIGLRWDRFFIMVDEGFKPGQTVTVKLQPTSNAQTLAKAVEQSKITTQPKRARADLA